MKNYYFLEKHLKYKAINLMKNHIDFNYRNC